MTCDELKIVQFSFFSPQVPRGGQPVHYVSYKRNAFYPMKLPKYTLPKVRPLSEQQQSFNSTLRHPCTSKKVVLDVCRKTL